MQRYDRQERLWSRPGQASLSERHIWAVGKSLSMCEALKNLALAGVGSLSLTMDPTPQNLFFDTEEAPLVAQLSLMRPGLRVSYTALAPCSVDLIITTIDHRDDVILQSMRNIPKLVVGTSLMRAMYLLDYNGLDSIPVLEPHLPAGLADVRFREGELWPQYRAYCEPLDLNQLSDAEHRYVPYCVLLAKAAEGQARLTVDGLRSRLHEMRRHEEEPNFAEALKYARKAEDPEVPEGLEQLCAIAQRNESDDPFWCLARALAKFVSKHRTLPVSGVIPDMKSGSAAYQSIRTLFREKAAADVDEISSYLERPLARDYVETFCRNSRFLRAFVRPCVVPSRLDAPTPGLSESEARGGVKPAAAGHKVDSFLAEFDGKVHNELAPVAAFIGGIAAQEALKLLLRQYTPLNGALFYDGSTQASTVVPGDMILIN